MTTFRPLVFAAALASACFAVHADELVANGSFEDNFQASGSWSIYPDLNGWTGGAHGIELRDHSFGDAYDQDNFVELDTTANSSMNQVLATTIGAHYTLSFAYSPQPGTSSLPADTNDVQVWWNGHLLTTLSGINTNPTDNEWKVYSFDVIGGENTVLQFAAVGTSDQVGGSLDAVSVTDAVPEPETYALMLAGLAALGLATRRRQR